MRIDRVRIDHFGRLTHYDTGPEALGRLVVVFGPNESGKSTFFNFARSMMYGFSPAARATNPYAPWSGADIEGHIDGHLDSGDVFQVRRRLRSSPWGRLSIAGDEVELRNRAVPFVEHVPAAVFQKMFALTLDELVALDRETWGALQDRLLASMVLDDLEPAKSVAESLRTDARALWRPDNRGQPRDRKITAEIKELQSARRVAAERDADLRRHQGQLHLARGEYATLRSSRDSLAAVLRLLERAVPANLRLRRLREARELQHQMDGAVDLPDNPAEVVERLETDLVRFEREGQRLGTRRAALGQEMDRYTDRDRALVELGSTLRSNKAAFESIPTVVARLETEAEALASATQRLDTLASTLFSQTLGPEELLAGIAKVSLEGVGEAVTRALTPVDATPDHPVSSGDDSVMPALVAMVCGVVLLLVASSRGEVLPAAFGGGLLFLAMLGLGLAWERRRRGVSRGIAAETARQASEDAQRAAVVRVNELLSDLPLRPEFLDNPELTLVSRLREVRELATSVNAHVLAVGERSADLEALEKQTDPLFEAAGTQAADGALALFRALDAAETRALAHTEASAAIAALEQEVEDLLAEQLGAKATLERLRKRIEEIGAGSMRRGYETVESWRSASRRAQDLERDFRRDLGEPEDVAAEIVEFSVAHPQWALEPASIESARTELDEITRRAETEGGLIQRLEGEVRHLESGDTTTEIDGRIAALTNERTRLRRDRDRLEMLGLIVEEAERRFKEHHQPDVLERSAAYLSRITDGRYRRLLPAHEGKEGVLSLETAAGRPVGLGEALSRGTKEQVLLSLRLAAADHMDHSGERLPLFVDEVFVNWDRGRRDRGLELLRQLSTSRQVFVFTCHADVAERLASLGSRVFELPTS